jgi:hypothetical protein
MPSPGARMPVIAYFLINHLPDAAFGRWHGN